MADSKSTKSSKSDEDAKAISPSDLDPDELAKAIEESVAAESKPAASPKTPKKDTENSGKKDNKTDEPKAAEAAPAEKPEEDKGVPIIVKRHSGYVTPPGSAPKTNEDEPAEKPMEPPSKTQKTLDPQSSGEQPAEENNNSQKPPPNSSNTTAADESEDAKEEEEPPRPEPVEAKSSIPQSPAELTSGTMPAEAAATAPEGTKDPTEESKPQKPTVFDTTEYHLPIKARNRKYVNSVVAWTVLAIVLAAAGGYVLYRLGIIEFGDLRTLN